MGGDRRRRATTVSCGWRLRRRRDPHGPATTSRCNVDVVDYDKATPLAAALGTFRRDQLVAVETDGVGLVVDPRPTNIDGWRVLDHAFLCGVAVEPSHC